MCSITIRARLFVVVANCYLIFLLGRFEGIEIPLRLLCYERELHCPLNRQFVCHLRG